MKQTGLGPNLSTRRTQASPARRNEPRCALGRLARAHGTASAGGQYLALTS